jgi:hypothetical protein
MSEMVDPVYPPPSKKQLKQWIVGVAGVIAIAVIIGVALRSIGATEAAEASIPVTATYPLPAHLEQWGSRTMTVCDSDETSAKGGSVTSVDTGPLDDVIVQVDFHGPGVINVDIQDGNGHRYHFVQQVTKNGGGARFAAIAPSPYSVTASARINSSVKPGAACTIPVN